MSERATWVDGAKAISIILLVIWHTGGDAVPFGEEMIFLRMPLFFFASGLFANRSMALPWRELFSSRIANLVYLYVVWTFLVHVLGEIPPDILKGRQIDFSAPFTLFWNPPKTLWFIYALAITYVVVRALLVFGWAATFALTLGLYLLVCTSGEWRDLEFLDRLLRLLPFFVLGLKAFPIFDWFVDRLHWAWLVLMPAFVVAAVYVFDSDLASNGLVTFSLSLLGILAVACFVQSFSHTILRRPLIWIGGSTLFIYVLHRIPVSYGRAALDVVGLAFNPVALVFLALAVVGATCWFGNWLTKNGFGALFSSSWLLARRKSNRAQA